MILLECPIIGSDGLCQNELVGAGCFFNAGSDVKFLATNHVDKVLTSIFTGRDAGGFLGG